MKLEDVLNVATTLASPKSAVYKLYRKRLACFPLYGKAKLTIYDDDAGKSSVFYPISVLVTFKKPVASSPLTEDPANLASMTIICRTESTRIIKGSIGIELMNSGYELYCDMKSSRYNKFARFYSTSTFVALRIRSIRRAP